MRDRRPIARAWWVLAALGFLWPAVLNGFPFLFYDVIGYVSGANLVAHGFFGAPIEWSRPPGITGRSVYYGAFLYLSLQAGGFWVAAAAQALLSAACVAMFLRSWPHVSGWTAFALLQATTLPFYVSFMLPDVLTGLAILSATALLLFWRRDGAATRAFWIAVATAAALSHPTNVPLLIAMAVTGLVASPQARPWLAAAALFAAAAAGPIGERAFAIGVAHLTGAELVRPPFVTARLTAGGPGTRYLRETCPANGFTVCRYIDRLPTPTANDFLWSEFPERGVFKSVPRDDARSISLEDARFGWATFRHAPMATLGLLATGTVELLRPPLLQEFNYYTDEAGFFQARLPATALAGVARSRAFASTMPTRIPVAVMRVLTFAGVLLCAWALLARSTPRDLRLTVALILCGLLVNAAVCGGLSGSYARYEDRILWLVPFAALLTLRAPRQD